jgi:uncharacterized protein (TIGR01777 family)
MKVRVLRRDGGMEEGGRLVLGIRRGPTEVKWEARHTEFQDGVLFRDEQVSGPFGSWIHTHSFLDGEEGGAIMEDEVRWTPPFGPAGQLFPRSLVERELERLFHFRHARLRHDLDLLASYRSESPLTVAVSGASGLLGTALTHFLRAGGHEVVPIRRGGGAGTVRWDPLGGTMDGEALEGVDAVVHLAGEPLFGFRWSREKKDAILRSRKEGTALLARTLASLRRKPGVLVSASAVGYYGNRGSPMLTEKSSAGKGFLSTVCQLWEEAAAPARRAGIRTVKLRTGMVLTPAGGALGTMLLPFKMGIGGRLGSGRQYVSWIDLDDVTGLIYHAIMSKKVKGPLNATAPHPVTNSAFTDTLGRVLGRPTLLPVPSLAVKAAFGEMGRALLLDGARVMPEKAEETGYSFRYPTLEESLRYQLGRPEARHGHAEP